MFGRSHRRLKSEKKIVKDEFGIFFFFFFLFHFCDVQLILNIREIPVFPYIKNALHKCIKPPQSR